MSDTDAPDGTIGNTLPSFSTQTSKKYGPSLSIISFTAAAKSSRFVTFLLLYSNLEQWLQN